MKTKKADRAVDMTGAPGPAPFLVPGHLIWGVLESIQPGPEDLIQVCIQGITRLVGVEILPKIDGHVGEQVTVWNIDGTFYAGVLDARASEGAA
jgi:hypothetical protein